MKCNKKIKKIIKIIIPIVIILLVLRYFISYYAVFFGLERMSKEEICNVLSHNINDFEDAVDLLTIHIKKCPYIKIERAEREYSLIDVIFHQNELLVKNRDGTIIEELQSEIENSNINHIMNNLDFELIVVDSEKICFVNRTSVGSAPQLIYTIDEKKPNDVYLWNAEKIIDNWYYWCD